MALLKVGDRPGRAVFPAALVEGAYRGEIVCQEPASQILRSAFSCSLSDCVRKTRVMVVGSTEGTKRPGSRLGC